MDGLLPFHKPTILPPMWHFNGMYFRSFSIWVPPFWRARSSRRAQYPRTRLYILLPVVQTLAQMEVGSPLWSWGHSLHSFWFTEFYGIHIRGAPRNNSGKWRHKINYTYPSSWVDLSLSTKHTHSQNFFPRVCHSRWNSHHKIQSFGLRTGHLC